jgi:hypothetical protein
MVFKIKFWSTTFWTYNMIPKHQQINVWMNMSETPEKKEGSFTLWLWQINICKMLISIFSWFFHTIFKDLTEQILSKMQQNASFCILLKFISIFSWFYHTIFKVLTTQILYPKCSRMHHFTSFWKTNFRPPPLPHLVSRGLACMPMQSVPISTDVVNSNLNQGEVYNIMWYCLLVTYDRSVVSSTNKTDGHNIIALLLNGALNTSKKNRTNNAIVLKEHGKLMLMREFCCVFYSFLVFWFFLVFFFSW